MTRPRVVAFDLGGVLVNVDKSGLYALHRDSLRVTQAFFGPEHDALSTGALDADAYLAGVASVLGIDVDVTRAAWQRVVSWSAGGLEVLVSVATRVPTLIWSNTDPLHWAVLAPVLENSTLAATLSFRCGFLKPDPRFYVAGLAGLVPSDVLFLDDRIENVSAARRAGCNAACVSGVSDAASALEGVLRDLD